MLLLKSKTLLYYSKKVNFTSDFMKNFLLWLIGFCLFWSFKAAAEKNLDFNDHGNWVIREEKIRENCEVDLFYVLPTIYSDKNNAYMLWQDNKKIQQKALMIASQHTGIFSGYSRVSARDSTNLCSVLSCFPVKGLL